MNKLLVKILNRRFIFASLAFALSLSLSAGELALEMKNANHSIEGMITGGQPTQSDIRKFAQKGVKRIINLRGVGEFDKFDEAAEAKAAGIEYVQLPIASKEDINKENAIKLDKLIKEAKGEVVIHCASGNRVGALLALREFYVNKKKPEQAIEFGKKAGMTRLTTVVEEKLKM